MFSSTGTTPLRYCWRSARAGWKGNMRYYCAKQSVNQTRRETMSLHPQPIPAIPEETIHVAHAVLPQGNLWMQMRDELGTLYEDQDFTDLFPNHGQSAEAPWRLALVTVVQYGEGLTDRQ